MSMSRLRRAALRGLGALFVGLAALSPASADAVTVFAAASLKNAFDDVAALWAEETGEAAVLSYAGSSALARQIEQGAPADIFVSANTAWMEALEGEGLIDAESRVDLLGNSLVLIAHGEAAPMELGPDTDLAGLLGGGRLAMALVDAVPAGIYGREALASLGIWEAVAGQVAQADNVRAALALVALGEAPFGIVYATDAAVEPEVSVIATFPEASHTPIRYPAAVVAGGNAAAGAAFLDFLRSDAAGAVFAEYGFTTLGGG